MSFVFSDLRKAAGFNTQVELSKRLGLKSGGAAISQWESGNRYPRASTIPLVAQVLGVTEGEVIAAITAAKDAAHRLDGA